MQTIISWTIISRRRSQGVASYDIQATPVGSEIGLRIARLRPKRCSLDNETGIETFRITIHNQDLYIEFLYLSQIKYSIETLQFCQKKILLNIDNLTSLNMKTGVETIKSQSEHGDLVFWIPKYQNTMQL